MFHCNGWCFAWTMAANAGTNVCLRKVEAKAVFDAIRAHRVTHYCGAPIVHSLLINAPDEMRRGIEHRVSALVAAAAPPAAMIEGMERIGFDITHVYGLTETYGPAAVCAKHDAWDALDIGARTERNGRQGVRYTAEEGMTVMDPATMREVPRDGATMGEIMFRGNVTMKGYLKNPAATAEAFAGGWFHSGDLAVLQADGYVKIKDRSKDVIISGGGEHQLARGRGRAVPPSCRRGRRGRRAARSQVGRDPVRVRGAQGRRSGDRGGTDRPLPGAARAVQGAEEDRFRRAAEDVDRQDPEVHAARAGEVGDRDRVNGRVSGNAGSAEVQGQPKRRVSRSVGSAEM